MRAKKRNDRFHPTVRSRVEKHQVLGSWDRAINRNRPIARAACQPCLPNLRSRIRQAVGRQGRPRVPAMIGMCHRRLSPLDPSNCGSPGSTLGSSMKLCRLGKNLSISSCSLGRRSRIMMESLMLMKIVDAHCAQHQQVIIFDLASFIIHIYPASPVRNTALSALTHLPSKAGTWSYGTIQCSPRLMRLVAANREL